MQTGHSDKYKFCRNPDCDIVGKYKKRAFTRISHRRLSQGRVSDQTPRRHGGKTDTGNLNHMLRKARGDTLQYHTGASRSILNHFSTLYHRLPRPF